MRETDRLVALPCKIQTVGDGFEAAEKEMRSEEKSAKSYSMVDVIMRKTLGKNLSKKLRY